MSTQSEEPRTSEEIDYMTDTRPIAAGETSPGCKKRDPIVVAENVTRSFGGINAVDVEYLEIPRHKITALIGPNGAGKTTLFNLLTGFDTPNSGKWQFEGNSLAGVSSYKVARMGMVRTFQLTKVMGKLTVMENMRLGASNQAGERSGASASARPVESVAALTRGRYRKPRGPPRATTSAPSVTLPAG